MTFVSGKELLRRHEKLYKEYHDTQEAMFNYKEYTRRCTGRVMTPRELHARREELFRELKKSSKKLREKGITE